MRLVFIDVEHPITGVYDTGHHLNFETPWCQNYPGTWRILSTEPMSEDGSVRVNIIREP
jgi:hypothetical protein